MKKLLLLVLVLLSWTSVSANAFDRIIFFGDSLSDPGNLYRQMGIPKPPYYNGHFSNGITWAENIGSYLNKDVENYALGGATVILHDPSKGFFPFFLDQQIQQYLTSSPSKNTDKSSTLYVIWIGANDYLSGKVDSTINPNLIVSALEKEIGILINHGAKYFLILDLPDLSKVPFCSNNSCKYQHDLQALSSEHNALLAKLPAHYPAVKIALFHASTVFNDFLSNPEKYNRIYNKHINNTSSPCWPGGYNLKNMDSSLPPAIAETDIVSKAYEGGAVQCPDPDDYMFWDKMHPTAVTHLMLAGEIIKWMLNPTWDDQSLVTN